MIKRKYTEEAKGVDSTLYFHDEIHDRKYDQIIGGVAWPILDEASAVIVARQFNSDHVWIIAALMDKPGGIFRFMSGAAKRWCCGRWYGNAFDEANVQLLHAWNRKHPGLTKVNVIDAPFVEEQNAVSVYFQQIRELASKLHDATDFDFKDKLDSVADDLRIEKSEGEHFVSVLSLGYALAALEFYGIGQAMFPDVSYEPLDEMSAI